MERKTTLNKIKKSNNPKPILTDDSVKCCQNCDFYNKEKNSCSHYFWNSCIVRNQDGYVVNYNYHNFR